MNAGVPPGPASSNGPTSQYRSGYPLISAGGNGSMLSGTTHVSAGMAGDTGAPRPTLLNAVSAACCPAGEHDNDAAATSAASVPDTACNAFIFDIRSGPLSRVIIGRSAVRVEPAKEAQPRWW